MRVSELIEKLMDCPPDAHVSMEDPYDPECDWTAPASIIGVYIDNVEKITLTWEYDND